MYSTPQKVKNGMKITEEFIWVQCYSLPDEKKIYETGHAIIQPKPKKDRKKGIKNNVNVFMLVFDSISRLNFIRQMPKSYEVLSSELGAVFMTGLNKVKKISESAILKLLILQVGDNTFPNMMPILSGYAEKAKTRVDEDFSPYWNNSINNFDDLPVVWKNFSKSGYTTLYNEDDPAYTMFNYHTRNGFKKVPTDYYSRPFWLAMETSDIEIVSNDSRCYAHLPKYQYLFNFTRDFVLLMTKEERSYFALTFSTQLSHNYLNSIKVFTCFICYFAHIYKVYL